MPTTTLPDRALKALPKPRAKACSAPKCSTRHYAKDLCKKHYAQALRHGRLTPELERGAARVCKVPDCGRTDTIRWHCRKHARQITVHGRLTPEREHVMGSVGCRVRGCPEPHRATGLCVKHYNQRRWTQIVADRQAAARGVGPRKKRLPRTSRGSH